MASNLALYSRVKDLLTVLEVQDERGVEMSHKAVKEAVELVNKVFGIIERRKNG